MLTKVVDKIFNPLVFQVAIIISTALMQIHILHYAYGGFLKYVLAFGLIVCFWQFVRKNLLTSIKDKASIAVLCFALSFAISIILNRDAAFNQGIKQLLYMIVFFLLLFSVNEKYANMTTISVSVVFITFILSFVSFLTLVLNINEWYRIESETYYIGTIDYFWGLYNPNVSGSLAVISIIATFFLFAKCKYLDNHKRFVSRIVLGLNIVLQFFMLIVSESRGSIYSLFAVLPFCAFILTLKNYKRDKQSTLLRVGFAILFSLLSMGILFAGLFIVNDCKNVIPTVSDEKSHNAEMDTIVENIIESVLRKYSDDSSAMYSIIRPKLMSVVSGAIDDLEKGGFSTSSRNKMWAAGFKVFLQKPLFGWTREGFVKPVNDILGVTGADSQVTRGGLHNIYLTVLCSSGIVGFLCLAFLFVVMMIRFVKRLLDNDCLSMELLFSLFMCLYFFVSELVEARILYTPLFQNAVFWTYLGYLNYYSLKGNTNIAKET